MSAYENKKWMWRSGFSYKTSAEIVGKVLTEIEEREGSVSAESFLDASRDESAETHDMFLWNDAEAAEQYRLGQARCIINQITYEVIREEPRVVDVDVEIVNDEPKTFTLHSAFVNIAPKGRAKSHAVFVSTEKALSDEDMRHQVLKNALSEIMMYTNKYRNYEEFARIFLAIDEVKMELLGEE